MIWTNRRKAKLVIFSMILTFLCLRTFLYFSPDTDLFIGNYNIHHIYTGILLVTFFGIPLVILEGKSRLIDISALLFGSGLSMTLDEVVFLIFTDGSNASYLLPVSVWGGLFLVSAAVFWILLILFISRSESYIEPE